MRHDLSKRSKFSAKSDRLLVQRFRKTNHMLTAFQIVIPGRRSEAEASPESITPVSGYGFRALDPRPSADGLAPE
jgi:hypothetical protein